MVLTLRRKKKNRTDKQRSVKDGNIERNRWMENRQIKADFAL